MGDDLVLEVDRDERHVLHPIDVSFTCCNDRLRTLGDQIVNDREIMGGQVPHNACIVLEQTQIDTSRIVVIEVAQRIVVDELSNLSNRTVKEKGVIHHNLQVFSLGKFDQLGSLGCLCREGFFDEYVFAV